MKCYLRCGERRSGARSPKRFVDSLFSPRRFFMVRVVVDHDRDDGELVLVMFLFNEQLHKQCSYIYRHSVWH